MSVAPPPPVRFTLDVAESRRIRDQVDAAAGLRAYPILGVSVAFQFLQPLLRFWRYGWRDPVGWTFAALLLALIAVIGFIVVRKRYTIAPALRPAIATQIAFDDSTLRVSKTEREKSATTIVAYADIRNISMTPEAYYVTKGLTPVLVIPKRAFPDDGAEFVRFFEDRLVGKRMLRRSTLASTTIVNTSRR